VNQRTAKPRVRERDCSAERNSLAIARLREILARSSSFKVALPVSQVVTVEGLVPSCNHIAAIVLFDGHRRLEQQQHQDDVGNHYKHGCTQARVSTNNARIITRLL
jgi:hypothetical protein